MLLAVIRKEYGASGKLTPNVWSWKCQQYDTYYETPANVYHWRRCNIPRDLNLPEDRCDNLQSDTFLFLSTLCMCPICFSQYPKLRQFPHVFLYCFVYVYLFFLCFCLIFFKLCIIMVRFMYSYFYICSALFILFSSCQLALFAYPNWGFSVLFPQL